MSNSIKEQTVSGLRWNDAVEAALIPTDFDRTWGDLKMPHEKERIGDDGKLKDYELVRIRAYTAYAESHKGEQVVVTFCDPSEVDARSRRVFRAEGILKGESASFPIFKGDHVKNERGFVVGDFIVPFSGLSSIEAQGDAAVVIL